MAWVLSTRQHWQTSVSLYLIRTSLASKYMSHHCDIDQIFLLRKSLDTSSFQSAYVSHACTPRVVSRCRYKTLPSQYSTYSSLSTLMLSDLQDFSTRSDRHCGVDSSFKKVRFWLQVARIFEITRTSCAIHNPHVRSASSFVWRMRLIQTFWSVHRERPLMIGSVRSPLYQDYPIYDGSTNQQHGFHAVLAWMSARKITPNDLISSRWSYRNTKTVLS